MKTPINQIDETAADLLSCPVQTRSLWKVTLTGVDVPCRDTHGYIPSTESPDMENAHKKKRLGQPRLPGNPQPASLQKRSSTSAKAASHYMATLVAPRTRSIRTGDLLHIDGKSESTRLILGFFGRLTDPRELSGGLVLVSIACVEESVGSVLYCHPHNQCWVQAQWRVSMENPRNQCYRDVPVAGAGGFWPECSKGVDNVHQGLTTRALSHGCGTATRH
jgi:hypothetical protein